MELLALLLQFALLLMVVAVRRNPKVSPLLATLLLFLILMWFTLPVVLTVLFHGQLPVYAYVDYSQFLFFAVLESATLLFTIAFLLVPQPYFNFIVNNRLTAIHVTPKGALFGVLCSVGFSLLTAVLASIFMGSSYFDQNAFFYLSEGSETFNNLGSIAFLQVILSCFCCACFVYVWPREQKMKWLLIALAAWALITVALQAPSGSRIAMLQPFFLLTLYCQAQPWAPRQKMMIVGLGALGTVVLGSILAVAIGQARDGDRLKLDDLLTSSTKAAEQNLVTEMAANIVTKFDSFSTGAILVERMGAGRAGIQPYLGALLAMVPRAILPGKPIPGSFDGTIRGYPTRVVAVQMGMSEEAGNVNISPASITVWQFGYFGLVVMVLCNVLHLYLLNSLLLAPSLLFKSLAFYLAGLPALMTIYAPPDILLMNVERVLLVFLLLIVIYHALQRRLAQRALWQRVTYRNNSFGET